MQITDYLTALDYDGALVADAAAAAGLLAPVPTCPGWQVRDLVWHLAYVHAWAARHVREQLPELIDDGDEAAIMATAPSDEGLLAGYRDGHSGLVATLRDADPDVQCVTFMPARSPLAFWARRQAHETAIHRYDAQSALPYGPPDPATAFTPAFADDGIDELIMCFAARRRYRLQDADADIAPHCLAIRPIDTAGRWHVTLSGATKDGAPPGDTTADGTTADGTTADGTTADGTTADGTAADGTAADGTAADGTAADGTAADSRATTVSRGDAPGADCVLSGPASGLYAYLWNRADPAGAAVLIDGDPAILRAWGANVRVAW